jgi:hypothetical protein
MPEGRRFAGRVAIVTGAAYVNGVALDVNGGLYMA